MPDVRADHPGGVDLYVGGPEHTVGHLLYARFWQKVLFDCGLVTHDEPIKKLAHQGTITGHSSAAQRDRHAPSLESHPATPGDHSVSPTVRSAAWTSPRGAVAPGNTAATVGYR